jgi:hypothetical protein
MSRNEAKEAVSVILFFLKVFRYFNGIQLANKNVIITNKMKTNKNKDNP